MTVSFLKRKLREYEEIKHQIEMLTRDVEQNGLSTMARSELTKAAHVLR